MHKMLIEIHEYHRYTVKTHNDISRIENNMKNKNKMKEK